MVDKNGCGIRERHVHLSGALAKREAVRIAAVVHHAASQAARSSALSVWRRQGARRQCFRKPPGCSPTAGAFVEQPPAHGATKPAGDKIPARYLYWQDTYTNRH